MQSKMAEVNNNDANQNKVSSEDKGYCVKCKEKRVMTNPGEKRSKTNRLMLQGECDVCGTKITKFIKDPNKLPKPVKEKKVKEKKEKVTKAKKEKVVKEKKPKKTQPKISAKKTQKPVAKKKEPKSELESDNSELSDNQNYSDNSGVFSEDVSVTSDDFGETEYSD